MAGKVPRLQGKNDTCCHLRVLWSELMLCDLDGQEESQSNYTRPSKIQSWCWHSVLSPARVIRSNSLDTLKYRQAARCWSFQCSSNATSHDQHPTIRHRLPAWSKARATTVTNARIPILGKCEQLWQYTRDSTSTSPWVGCCIIQAPGSCSRSR